MDDKWAVDQQPPWTACCQYGPTADQPYHRLTHQSTTLSNERRQWWTRAEFKSGPPLMRGLNVHKNIPVSITKLTLGHRVGFVCSHLIAGKLSPINPRSITCPPKMSLLLEAKSMPALIIKPRFILVGRGHCYKLFKKTEFMMKIEPVTCIWMFVCAMNFLSCKKWQKIKFWTLFSSFCLKVVIVGLGSSDW